MGREGEITGITGTAGTAGTAETAEIAETAETAETAGITEKDDTRLRCCLSRPFFSLKIGF